MDSSKAMGGMKSTGGSMSSMPSGGVATEGGTTSVMTSAEDRTFKLRIENVSANSAAATPFAPGAFAVTHGSSMPLTTGLSPTVGLEHAAEDGSPTALSAELTTSSEVAMSGVFNTPVGATAPGPIVPGTAYEVTFHAATGDRLHFESMFGQSNDVYVTTPKGIPLFDEGGMPASGDQTSHLSFWDAGSERNEAPGMGPNQAPRQMAPNTGPAEGGIAKRTDGTRALPIPSSLVNVEVTLQGETYSITVSNRSGEGPAASPLSPVFYAVHSENYHYMMPGAAASAGLERLAEDGNSAVLVTEATSASAMAGTAGTKPILPGASVSFTVTPTMTQTRLSLAMMVGQTNDAFLGTRPEGIPVRDDAHLLRPASAVKGDLMRLLAVWDAGTEMNEAPGVGPNQAPRQAAPNTGIADANDKVRLYADSTNDFEKVTELIDVNVVRTTGLTFQVKVVNHSASTAFPVAVSPVAWVTHGEGFAAIDLGRRASAGLEALAEDGASSGLLSEWAVAPQVYRTGVAGTAPIMQGQEVMFEVTADPAHRYFNLAAMLVPSNDTFVSLGGMGVALLDAAGVPRSDSDIAEDVKHQLAAYESGTEANQGSALGPDMAPYQKLPNTGANEGSGQSRPIDGVWAFPPVAEMLKVTLSVM